jgi:hypothetical protein
MRSVVFGEIFDIGRDILHVALNATTKVALVQFGDSTGQVADSDAAELWQAPGLLSLPATPSQSGPSCQGLVLKCGDRDRVFACRDTRAAPICADMVAGDTCIFGTGTACSATNGRIVSRATGALELRTTVGIDLGGSSTSYVALATKVDAITAQLKTLAQVLGGGAPIVVGSSGVPQPVLVAAAEALANAITSVAAELVKAT